MILFKNDPPVGIPNLLGGARLQIDTAVGTTRTSSGLPCFGVEVCPTNTAFFKVFDTVLSLAFQALLNRRFRPLTTWA
jgi:hypothetical protein